MYPRSCSFCSSAVISGFQNEVPDGFFSRQPFSQGSESCGNSMEILGQKRSKREGQVLILHASPHFPTPVHSRSLFQSEKPWLVGHLESKEGFYHNFPTVLTGHAELSGLLVTGRLKQRFMHARDSGSDSSVPKVILMSSHFLSIGEEPKEGSWCFRPI